MLISEGGNMEENFYRRFCRRFFGGALIILFLVSPSFSQGPAEKTETLSIKKIEVTESAEGSRVSIEGSKPFEYKVFKSVNPLRVVVDLPQAKLGKLVGPIKVQSGAVNVIQNKQIDDPKNPRARIEIGLDRLVEYNATSEGNYLYIDFGKPPVLLAKEIKKEQEVKKEEPQKEKPLPRSSSVTDVAISTKPNIVEVEIKGDGPMPDYRSYQLARPPRLVIDLPKMVNVSTKKNIDVGSQLLQNIRLGQTPEKLRVVLTFPGNKLPRYKVTKEGQDLKVLLGGEKDETVRKEPPPPALPAKPTRVAEAEPKKVAETAAPPPAEKPPVQEREPPAETKPDPEAERSQAAQFRGARLSLDFKDADLHNIFRLIAEVSNLNIITTDDVKGKITIRMVNVPWDQALEVILSTKNLIKIEEGNVLRITTMENVRKDREEKQKEEDILIKSRESKEKLETLHTETIVVNYAKATDLQKLIREKDDKGKGFLGPRGSVKADERTNTLIIQDSRAQIEEIQNLVKKLDTPTPQVLIEARIVQAVTTFARSLGVQWGGSYNQTGSTAWGLTGNNPSAAAGWGFTPSATGASTNLIMPSNFVVNFPASSANTPVGGMGISFGKITGDLVNLDLRLQLGETDGQTKVIARPKLATLTNREALIKQGERIPYETTSQAGTQIQWEDAVLQLKVTPRVTGDGTIMMEVQVNRDARGTFRSAITQVPSKDVREAKTEVLVKDGETVVIGGIYESENSETQQGIPWLMKIPVLGWLFKNQEVLSTKKELLIFITPTLMAAKAGS